MNRSPIQAPPGNERDEQKTATKDGEARILPAEQFEGGRPWARVVRANGAPAAQASHRGRRIWPEAEDAAGSRRARGDRAPPAAASARVVVCMSSESAGSNE